MGQELLLNPLHRQAGATLGTCRDWIVPLHFGNPHEEYQSLRRHAGLIDWSIQTAIEVRGADRIAFLHNMLTNDIKRLAPSEGCAAALVSPTAKLIAPVKVLTAEQAVWLLVDRMNINTVLTTLDHYRITEDVTLREKPDAVFTVQGPTSLAVIEQRLGGSFAPGHLWDHTELTLEDVPIRVVCATITGERGVMLMVIAEHAAWLWRTLAQVAAPVGWEALNVARIEAGVPWYGVDVDETNVLPETGLEKETVSYTKGCYVGQEIMARLQTYGSVSQKLVGLIAEGSIVPQPQDPVLENGRTAGRITSACLSFALGKPIALGYVKRPFYEPGTAVTIAHQAQTIPATVVQLPFVPLQT